MAPRNRGPRGPGGARGTRAKTQPLKSGATADATPIEATDPRGGSASPVDSDGIRRALAQDYEVLEELGRGGMAIVYRALERELEREVAIKVLPPAMTMDAEFVDRFQREARTAGQLEHPNIVPIYRVGRKGERGDVIFFVMKFLRGQSLAQVLRDRPRLPVSDVKRILIETASALGYAAKRGVVHRDIKPDNIMLDGEGRCVVTDFGIAKTSSGPLTAAGTSMGTPRYMSPEHAQGTKLDGRSDLYSLGVVAYQCLAGTTPYDADDPFAILYKHINEPLPRPELETDEEWAMYAVIERMLAKKPDDRFQAADDLIAALGGTVHTVTLVNANATSPQTVFGPTEIIPTPPAGLKWTLPANWRLWGAAAGVALVMGMGALVSRPQEPIPGDTSTSGTGIVGTGTGATEPAGTGTAGGGGGRDSAAADTTGTKMAGAAAPPGGAATQAAVTPPATRSASTTAPAPTPRRPVPEPYSACPRLPASEATKSLVVLVDRIQPQTRGGSFRVFYDVCGMAAGAPYGAEVTVTRTDQGRFDRAINGRTAPVVENFASEAEGPRTRRFRTVELGNLPSGKYELRMKIADRRDRVGTGTALFEIRDPR